MGESPNAYVQMVDFPDTITNLRNQMISIVGNQVREALSSSRNLQYQDAPSPPASSKDKRRLQKKTGPVPTSNNDESSTVVDLPQFRLDEVAYHDTQYDCWVVIYDRVYDITSFLYEHPGGKEIIMEHAGRDATLAFRSVGHSNTAEDSLKQYRIGILVEEDRLWTRFFNLVADTPARNHNL